MPASNAPVEIMLVLLAKEWAASRERLHPDAIVGQEAELAELAAYSAGFHIGLKVGAAYQSEAIFTAIHLDRAFELDKNDLMTDAEDAARMIAAARYQMRMESREKTPGPIQ